MKIRKAKKSDIEEIANILREESSKKPYNERYSPKKSVQEVERLLKEDLYVAVIDDIVIGFIASSVTRDDNKKVYIDELWLSLKYQKQGVGKALMTYVENRYKARGIKVIRLVTKKSSGAFKFYKKLKYKETTGMVFVEKKLG